MDRNKYYKLFHQWSNKFRQNHKDGLSFTERSTIYHFGLTLIMLNEYINSNEVIAFLENCVFYLRKNHEWSEIK